ncbi:MAG: DUF4058 family protein [Chloroflexi bacterium]|nr:DUF4058 family protein [Chloroflexota bacterium]MBI4315174.1 DUF4058 family protein [Chloroflexota bacterium]MBI5829478.1 DUF4058 family protein [Chloroflexota bacterium]
MPSPFPGMDPYIEQPAVWPDFHSDLAGEIRARLNPHLRPRYFATTEITIIYENAVTGKRHQGRPDVGVHSLKETQLAYEAAPAAGIGAPEPVESRVVPDDPLKFYSVEIRTASERKLVTSIEILSPANKQRGHDAFEIYERKRRGILVSETHFIEIDLLRGGERPQLVDPVPPAPYYITLSRAERRPKVMVWPVQLRNRLPVIPVPLREPDPDVPLDLGAVVAAVYERGAYDIQLDYNRPPPPPPLSAEEQTWVEMILKREKQNAQTPVVA